MTTHVHGVKELNEALKKLSAKIAEKTARTALRKAANMVARQVRANAPVKTGRLKKAIKVKTSKIHRLNKNGNVGVFLSINPGKNRADAKGAWYGTFVENGYNRGSKAIGGREAVARGVVSKQQYQAKRALVNSRRRFGRVKQGIRYRAGGQRVEGLYFLRNTFEAIKETAVQTIISGGYDAVDKAVKELNLK